jgi:hypothetical protein
MDQDNQTTKQLSFLIAFSPEVFAAVAELLIEVPMMTALVNVTFWILRKFFVMRSKEKLWNVGKGDLFAFLISQLYNEHDASECV